eukprot:10747791-Lingulodinium_polyedra.AAC.1
MYQALLHAFETGQFSEEEQDVVQEFISTDGIGSTEMDDLRAGDAVDMSEQSASSHEARLIIQAAVADPRYLPTQDQVSDACGAGDGALESEDVAHELAMHRIRGIA